MSEKQVNEKQANEKQANENQANENQANETEKKIDFYSKYSIIPEQKLDNKSIYYDYLKERNDYIDGTKELNDKHILIQTEITWAMNDYGVILYNSGQVDEAKQIWKKSAKLKDPYACGYLYLHFRLKTNINKQLYYCEKEIEYGCIEKCIVLFNYYYDQKNWKKTDEYMKKYIELDGKKYFFEMILKANLKISNDVEKYTDEKVYKSKLYIHFLLIFMFIMCQTQVLYLLCSKEEKTLSGLLYYFSSIINISVSLVLLIFNSIEYFLKN